jgi:hypothetical protein
MTAPPTDRSSSSALRFSALRRDLPAACLEAHALGLLRRPRGDELVGAEAPGLRVVGAAAHEALDADDGVARVLDGEPQRLPADHHAAAIVVVHRRRHQALLIAVGDDVRPVVAHAGDQRVGGAEVDADGAGPSLGVEDFEE